MKAIVWSKDNCPFCDQAKSMLKQSNFEIEERKIGNNWTKEQLLEMVPNARTVPQIFINNVLVGGLNDLRKYISETMEPQSSF